MTRCVKEVYCKTSNYRKRRGVRGIEKTNLIKRAELWKQKSKRMPLMGYTRNGQQEITKISSAIIKALCEMENMTPNKAKEALKMAEDIIDEEMKHDTIL